uniref:MFS domain-containing protein n=1 Tax=Parastrongyloides trichosuri TaxID=131310 RepID=A0A0N4ZE98_PARTI
MIETGLKLSKMQKPLWNLIFDEQKKDKEDGNNNKTRPRLIYVMIVIFLEYFSWGLITMPTITFISRYYGRYTFIMNGLALGSKGFISFVTAPILGRLTDLYGRKPYLLTTVLITCTPIPCLLLPGPWYITIFVFSGFLGNSFSIVNAYAADITTIADRHNAYALISATFGASFTCSPFLGALLSERYGNPTVILLALFISLFNLFFIYTLVPESHTNNSAVEPIEFLLLFNTIREFYTSLKSWKDDYIFKISMVVFFSSLSETGQISCFFIFLRIIIEMSMSEVGMFIAYVGILAVLFQAFLFKYLINTISIKGTVALALLAQMIQLFFYGLCFNIYVIWGLGIFLAISQMVYPALSAAISLSHTNEEQGSSQAVINGIRALCSGIGPAIFGIIFNFFGFDVSADYDNPHNNVDSIQFQQTNIEMEKIPEKLLIPNSTNTEQISRSEFLKIIPGPPFLLGAISVFIAFFFLLALKKPKIPGKRRHSPRTQNEDTTTLLTDHSEEE